VSGLNRNDEDAEMDAFLKEQEKSRKNVLKHLNIDKIYVDHLYRFLEWCDPFSLFIYMDKIQHEDRKKEIFKSPHGEMK